MYFSLGSSWDLNVLFTRKKLGFKCIFSLESSWGLNVFFTKKQFGFKCIIQQEADVI